MPVSPEHEPISSIPSDPEEGASTAKRPWVPPTARLLEGDEAEAAERHFQQQGLR
jgi:hypothetical protein